jgi:SulP family sulfate permease
MADLSLVITALDAQIHSRLTNSGLSLSGPRIRCFADLDHGLEWCEEQLIVAAESGGDSPPKTALELFLHNGLDSTQVERLLTYCETRSYGKGETLWRQYDEADCLYFIITGRVSIYGDNQLGEPIRLSTVESGASVGEMGVYLDTLRSAAVVADRETSGVLLSRKELQRMESEEPQLAAAFHAMIARQLAGWLLQADRSIKALRCL